ncbi:MAG TPA: chaplin [Streptosporangiaceae bacterium]|jgi:hypothetical protein
MRTWARWTARAALFTASFAAVGATAGLASAGTTSGNHSIGGGNQVTAPISVPVNACGNAVALLGDALGGCQGGAGASGGSGSGNGTTSGNHSIGGGNQVYAPISVPVDVCGNAVAVLGHALAGCPGGAWVSGGRGSGSTGWTSGNHSIGGGNQVNAPVRVPVNVCGNAVGNAKAACKGGASVHTTAFSGSTTSGNHSILGGNQISVPISIPVNVCGNAAAVLGGALAGCAGGASTGHSGHMGWQSSGPEHAVLTAAHVVRQSATSTPRGGALSLPELPTLPTLPALSSLPASGLTGSLASATKPVQAKLLSAEVPQAATSGMGSSSLLAMAAGAVLAGAATLVAAGRRLGIRRAAR